MDKMISVEIYLGKDSAGALNTSDNVLAKKVKSEDGEKAMVGLLQQVDASKSYPDPAQLGESLEDPILMAFVQGPFGDQNSVAKFIKFGIDVLLSWAEKKGPKLAEDARNELREMHGADEAGESST